MAIERIIVLEDDLIVRKNLEHQLRNRRYDVAVAATIAEAHELLNRDGFDLIILDVRLTEGAGMDLLKIIQQRPQRPLCVVTTGFSSVESAVECMKHGAFDYLIKPFSAEQIGVTLKKAEDFTQLLRVNRYLNQENEDIGHELLGNSPAMESLRQLIRKVARTQATVLIQGESGTGKELVARAIYRESPRAHAPFIKVNCAAIPENLIESELFGQEKGGLNGALTKREGRFELANGGTILLDEISEISPVVQAKLLRVLQERELERVGGNRAIKVDVRVLATTNRQLEQSVKKKEFRQDLFFRLNVVPIPVPPLRERAEDVPNLAEEFMRRYSRKHGVEVCGFSDTAKAVLKRQQWPGNVRELQSLVERAVIRCGENRLLEPEHLGLSAAGMISTAKSATLELTPDSATRPGPAPTATAPSEGNGFHSLAELEKQHILAAMEKCNGNRTHAARILDISIRTLRNKLHEYNGTGNHAAPPSARATPD